MAQRYYNVNWSSQIYVVTTLSDNVIATFRITLSQHCHNVILLAGQKKKVNVSNRKKYASRFELFFPYQIHVYQNNYDIATFLFAEKWSK